MPSRAGSTQAIPSKSLPQLRGLRGNTEADSPSSVLLPPLSSLSWFVRLRWFGYLGAVPTLVAAQLWLHVQFHVGAISLLLLVGVLSNALAQVWLQRRPETAPTLGVLLVLDVVLLSLGLAYTGGPLSPFLLAYFVPLVIAAVTLPPKGALSIVGACVLGLAAISRYHQPLLADHEHDLQHAHHVGAGPFHSATLLNPAEHVALHLQSAWVGVLLVGLLVVYLVRRALQQREAQIEELRRQRDRMERLAELSTLTASATHALGSPLSTIAVIAGELERELQESGESDQRLSDVRAISVQVERCREVLSNMANDARTGPEPRAEVALRELCESARAAAVKPELIHLVVQGDTNSRALLPRRSLLGVLASLLDNAQEAAPGQRVDLCAFDTGHRWRIEVLDRGQPIPSSQLSRLGQEPASTKPFGMGMGLFLGRAVLERLGGTLEFRSQEAGMSALLTLPLSTGAGAAPETVDAVRAGWEL